MKKFKILALVMTCAILLSSIMIIPVSAAEPESPTATNVMGKEITVDGRMGADEGWSVNPLYSLALDIKDPTVKASNADTTEDTDPATVRFSYDGDYIYIYYETKNPDLLAKSLASNKYQSFYMMLRGKEQGMAKDANQADGSAVLLAVNLGGDELAALSTSQAAVKPSESYVWKGSDPTTNAAIVRQFRYTKDGSNNFSTSSTVYKDTEIAVYVTRDEQGVDKMRSIEIKYPLTAYKEDLQAATGADLCISLWDKTQNHNGTYVDNAGYIVDYETYNWNGNAGVGVPLNLPSTNLLLDEAKTAPVLVGFQSRTNPNDNSKYDVRFVSVVDDYTGFDLNTSKLGYLFNNGTKDSEKQYCTTVYETLKAGDSTIKATDFGGQYFFCFTITGMDPAETYNWTVKCFTQADAEDAVEYCKNPVTVEITYDSTEKKAVFTY